MAIFTSWQYSTAKKCKAEQRTLMMGARVVIS